MPMLVEEVSYVTIMLYTSFDIWHADGINMVRQKQLNTLTRLVWFLTATPTSSEKRNAQIFFLHPMRSQEPRNQKPGSQKVKKSTPHPFYSPAIVCMKLMVNHDSWSVNNEWLKDVEFLQLNIGWDVYENLHQFFSTSVPFEAVHMSLQWQQSAECHDDVQRSASLYNCNR